MNELVVVENILPGSEVAGLFNPEIEEGLSTNERRLLTTLLGSDDRVDITIPAEVSTSDLWDAAELCCKVFVRVRQAGSQLKLLIGRSLVLMQTRPELYTSRGFTSFDQFMSSPDGLPGITGISRSELYKAKMVASQFPSLSLADSRDIGFTKLGLIAGVTRDGDSTAAEWVAAAKVDTIPELRERIYRSDNQIPDGSLETDVLQLVMSRAHKECILEFITSPEVAGYCGTSNPGDILARMVEEVGAEWRTSQGLIEAVATEVEEP